MAMAFNLFSAPFQKSNDFNGCEKLTFQIEVAYGLLDQGLSLITQELAVIS